jgi:DNA-binding CsgD family transcriptional regulator
MRRANGGGAVQQRDVELTARQREVLRLIAAGKTNAEIGEALGISLDGAKWHVSEILAKLDVATREEAGEWWRRREGLRARLERVLRALVPGAGWLKVGGAVAAVSAVAALVVVVVALRDAGRHATQDLISSVSTPISASPVSQAARCPNVIIDWIVAFRFDGVTYVPSSGSGRALTLGDLGAERGKTTFRMDDQCDPYLHMQDTWSTVLPPGTSIYEIRGYSPQSRLAAQFGGALGIYEADTAPSAKTGGDLVDLRGKVASIQVISSSPQRSISGSITDPATVARLVDMVLSAPVAQDRIREDGDSVTAVIVFRTRNGLDIERNYFGKSGEIVRGIMTPPEFQAAIAPLLSP